MLRKHQLIFGATTAPSEPSRIKLSNSSVFLIKRHFNLSFSCIFTIGRTTYVDFLPFYNPEGGSELNILRVIIHFKKFELLTHPICELFLHLKWLRARYLYWISNVLNILFTILAIIYVLLSYGNMDKYINIDSCKSMNNSTYQPISESLCHPEFCYSQYRNRPA